MTRYLLNSAVITAPGRYHYHLLTPAEARAWLARGPFTSAIRYAQTAQALSDVTGVEIPVADITTTMEVGDEALVFRLVLPPGGPRVAQGAKGHLPIDFIFEHSEIGLLVREPDAPAREET